MYQNINGVRFREFPETLEKPLLEKRFDIQYMDNTYLYKTIFLDFINLPVKGHGRMWIFVVKNLESVEEYKVNSICYGEIVGEVHNRLIPYLQQK
ncbi:hypothetical protein [Metabacillus litoralis]|jgi:hypothetical protein|uniref:hypothetical protein n=1 Tax=Metabacillus litoralis TaxID=152268 RepID=UPI002040248A|nr:hypothetical protein [Metabacillus litoralis]MCM3655337.1 hypothetical protein [Metabacillus litoralis]